MIHAVVNSDLPVVRRIEFRVVHYEPISPVSWHVHLQLARVSDPAFASPLLSVSTADDVAGWLYRDEQLDSDDGSLAAYPDTGIVSSATGSPTAGTVSPIIATAVYVLTDTQRVKLPAGPLLCRARQSPSGGATWGYWYSWIL